MPPLFMPPRTAAETGGSQDTDRLWPQTQDVLLDLSGVRDRGPDGGRRGPAGRGSQLCCRNVPPAESTFPLRLCGCCSADCRLLCFADILFCFWFLHPICFFFITETLR